MKNNFRRTLLKTVPLSLFLRNEVIFPFCHVISDYPLPHVQHLYYYGSVKSFVSDLDVLLKNYKPVDLKTVIKFVSGEKRMKEPSFHITFDDGFRECYEVIMPVLIGKGIPATFFVCTDFIDNKDMYFKNKISILLDKTMISREDVIKKIKRFMIDNGVKYKDSGNVFDLISGKYADLVNELCLFFDVDILEYLEERQPYLTSEQIKKMVFHGFDIGSHSINHSFFSEISLKEQIDQLRKSVFFLKEKFLIDNCVFAFPHSDKNITREFYSINESLVDIFFGTENMKKDSIKNSLQRFSIEDRYLSMDDILKQNYLFRIYNELCFNNVIKRSA